MPEDHVAWRKMFKKTHLIFEAVALLQGQAVCLGDNRDNIDDIAQLLHHNNINGTKAVTSRVDKVQAAVNASILDVTFTLSSQLLAQVRRVLVLDIFDDGVPASHQNLISFYSK